MRKFSKNICFFFQLAKHITTIHKNQKEKAQKNLEKFYQKIIIVSFYDFA